MKKDLTKPSQKSAFNLNEHTITLINKLQSECFDLMTQTPPNDLYAFYKQQSIRLLVSNRFTPVEVEDLIKLEENFMLPVSSSKHLKIKSLDPYKTYSYHEKKRHEVFVISERRYQLHLFLRKKLVAYIDFLMKLMRKYGIDLRDEIVKEKLG